MKLEIFRRGGDLGIFENTKVSYLAIDEFLSFHI
jgi:hypothetical protein